MVLYHALVLFPMTCPSVSVDCHNSSDSRSRILLWAAVVLSRAQAAETAFQSFVDIRSLVSKKTSWSCPVAE